VGAVLSLAGGGLPEMYFVVYMAILLLWPYDVGPRYIFPVLPLCFVYLYRGWRHFVDWRRQYPVVAARLLTVASAAMTGAVAYRWVSPSEPIGLQTKAAMVFWALSSLAGLMWSIGGTARRFRGVGKPAKAALAWVPYVYLVGIVAIGMGYQVRMAKSNLEVKESELLHYPTAQAGRWFRDHTSSDTVVMAFNAWSIHSISQRHVIHFPATGNVDIIVDVARRHNVNFLVILQNDSWFEPSEEDRLRALVAKYPSMLELVHAGRGYQIFRFV